MFEKRPICLFRRDMVKRPPPYPSSLLRKARISGALPTMPSFKESVRKSFSIFSYKRISLKLREPPPAHWLAFDVKIEKIFRKMTA